MLAVLKTIVGFLVHDRASKKFAFGVLFGLGFSVSIILATIGIMDGFESTLKAGLKRSMGDISIHSRKGFFKPVDEFASIFKSLRVTEYSSYVKSEGFVIHNEASKAVQVNGIDFKSFSEVSGISLKLETNSVAIGSELAEQFSLKVGDEVVLALPNGNEEFSSLPLLTRRKVGQIITHGIYLKDLRLIYIDKTTLQASLNIGPRVNMISLNLPLSYEKEAGSSKNYTDIVSGFKRVLQEELDMEYLVRPFWREYAGLIEAVRVEKVMIGIILQIIVIIAIFNVLAFIIFINEQRSREIFLFKALGMSQRNLMKVWLMLGILLWMLSCGIAMSFVSMINYALLNFSFLKLPGEIYTLGQLHIELDLLDYSIVFGGTLVWLLLVSGIAFIKMKRGSIISGLRKEFA
ncbi:MAG: ABC transporter permease [Bacteriovoracaceae bacterium]|nr:ABC transporter permease [Bacteriovoracaceae bacterium]